MSTKDQDDFLKTRVRPPNPPNRGRKGMPPMQPGARFDISLAKILPSIGVLIGILVGGILFFIWFGMRIEVGAGEMVVLVKKTGTELVNDQILAPDDGYKGVQQQILKEGRHFRNPYLWAWEAPIAATMIPQGKVGIRVRKRGDAIDPTQILALGENDKGILSGVLTPGRYYLNPRAYDVAVVDMVKIEPGFVGVVTLQVGKKTENPFAFVVPEGSVGVQLALLPAGTHPEYSNPYVHRVTSIDVRSQKFEMRDEYAISFPSKHGFDISVEGTIEWAPDLEKLPELLVKYVDDKDLRESGGINNIQQKVILPFARSFFRTIGGRYKAVDYITGDTRVVVQNEVETRLKETCAAQGILVRSVVIRSTEPPDAIRNQFQRRELARLQKDRFMKEIEMQIGTPALDENGKPTFEADGTPLREGGRLTRAIQERQKEREQNLGVVREEIATLVRKAEEYRNIEVTQGNLRVEVAKINLEAAKDRAAGVTAEGFAEAAVKVMQYEAEAEGVREKVSAFGKGEQYAEYLLIEKLAPGIQDILSDTEGTFAELFQRFSKKTGKGSQ
jgi:hypothetical protein